MRRLFYLPVLFLLAISCKDSKTDYAGQEKISAEDFLKAFVPLKLPFTVADTSLKNFADTIVISKTIFMEFIPDSAINEFVFKGKNETEIHPAGIIHQKERDYLLASFSSAKKTRLGVFVLNDKHQFLASFPLINTAGNDQYTHSVSVTTEPTFILKREKISRDNKSLYSRVGYAYNSSANTFNDVLHDSNEDSAKNDEIINPIDTLPVKFKYSGNYGGDKKNFIALRDGRSAGSYQFFIHFEKNKGACVGELKGEMRMTNDKEAVFTENGDPCIIDFKFSGNTIKIKEQNNCGNHRGISCPYDFTFRRKPMLKRK